MPTRRRAGLVDDQVAVIERLQPEEVEVQVGGRVKRAGQPGEVVVQQRRVDPLDRHAKASAGLEGTAVGVTQARDPVADDVPAERLLVDVGEQHPPGEQREVGVALDQRLGVEQDQPSQVLSPNARAHRAAQLPLELLAIERHLQPDRRERDPRAEVRAIPVDLAPSASITGIAAGGGACGRLAGAEHRAFGPVDDVALGHPHVPGQHQLLLDDVLDGLDRDIGAAERARRARCTRADSAPPARGWRPATGTPCGSRPRSWSFQATTSPERRISRRPRGACGEPTTVGAARCRTSALASSNWPASINDASVTADRSAIVDGRRHRRAGDRSRRRALARNVARAAAVSAMASSWATARAERASANQAARRRRVMNGRSPPSSSVTTTSTSHSRPDRAASTSIGGRASGGSAGALELEVLEDLGEIDHHGRRSFLAL